MRTKTKLCPYENAKTVLIWDPFKAQSSKLVKDRLKELNIMSVMVPKNMKHLLQPLDLSTKGDVKNMEKRAFSDYFMMRNTKKDVTTIEIDLRLSTLKPRHVKLMKYLYEYLLTDMKGSSIILSGWRSAGILDCVEKTVEIDRFRPLTPTLIRILRTVLLTRGLSFIQWFFLWNKLLK